jgi:hypothetical protein
MIKISKEARKILNKDNKWIHLLKLDKRPYLFKFIKTKEPILDEDKQKEIDKIWEESKKEARKKGKILFSGAVLGIKSVNKNKNFINIEYFENSYKYILAARKINISPSYKYFIGVRGLCQVTINNQPSLIIGMRDSKTTKMGGFLESIPAGILTPQDLRNDSSVLTKLRNELNQELGIRLKNCIQEKILLSIKGLDKFVTADIRIILKLKGNWINKFNLKDKKLFYILENKVKKFPEHKEIFIVPLENLSAFIELYKNEWAVTKDILLDFYEFMS